MPQVFMEKSTKGNWTNHARSLRNYATYKYAQDFHKTAMKTGSPVVRAYLLGHALELYLKAFLLQSGLSSTVLKRKYSHNLDKLLAESKLKGIEKTVRISKQMEDDIASLNTVYPETLRYFSLLHLLTQPRIPSLARLFRLAASMSKKLEGLFSVK